MSDTEIQSPVQEGELPQESMEEFKARVEARTGVKFDDIPKSEDPKDALYHIFCRRGNIYVVGVDQYPEEDEEGGELYKEFRVVDLSVEK